MSQGGSKLQIENLTHALQHAQDLSKCNSKLHKVQKMKIYCKFNTHSLAIGSFSVSGEQTDAHKAC